MCLCVLVWKRGKKKERRKETEKVEKERGNMCMLIWKRTLKTEWKKRKRMKEREKGRLNHRLLLHTMCERIKFCVMVCLCMCVVHIYVCATEYAHNVYIGREKERKKNEKI